jgi:hypothetical protein
MNNQVKYLKYKNKYLDIKKQLGGTSPNKKYLIFAAEPFVDMAKNIVQKYNDNFEFFRN